MRLCVSHVKVRSVVYRYNRPPCVDLFLFSLVRQQTTRESGHSTVSTRESGTPIRDGVVQLDISSQTVICKRFASSLAKSQAFDGTGCYVTWAMIQVVGSGRTTVRCSSFSASGWIKDFTYVNSSYDCSKNTGLGFAE